MSNTRRQVGITGAGGNVGTTLVRGLAANYDLTLFDRQPLASHPDGAKVKVLNCADRQALTGAFEGLDSLIHLVGDPSPGAPRASTMQNNFLAFSLTCEEARRAGVRRIVFASSNFYHEGDIGKVLRNRSEPLITLDRPPTPECLYGESKVYGESVGRHLSYLGVSFVALRIGWTVPDDDPSKYWGGYMRAVYCSHRDLVEAFSRALEVETDFLAAFAVSRNEHGVFDLAETERLLGFHPKDNAETARLLGFHSNENA
ncbi:MAG: NAD(P)-dependent oxidoreductase [Candidatus Riflebacteria bacterium]|nr:NAD(P)-dependent oxidoreductase [Candidatus Riflebacteria bacterium]